MCGDHIVLIGLPGVGKTSIVRKLGALYKEVADIDRLIENQYNTSIRDLIDKKGEKAFRLIEAETLQSCLQSPIPLIISTGGGIANDLNAESLQKNKTIHIRCDIDEIAERVDVSGRPLLYNTNKKDQLLKLWNQRKDLYQKVAQTEIDITGLTLNIATQTLHNYIKDREWI